MKIRSYNSLLFGLILIAGMVSCNKETENEKLSENALKSLQTRFRMNAMNAEAGQNGNFMSVIAESQFRTGDMNMDDLMVDSSYYEYYECDTCPDIWYLTSCATITETDNQDGTHTTVYDYGEGCYEYGWLTRGKITYTWSNDENSYFSRVDYDQYYSYGMLMNGYSEYSYTSDGNSWVDFGRSDDPTVVEGDSGFVEPVYHFYWSGTSTGEDSYTVLFDSGESYSYTSEYANSWDSISSRVLVGYYHYTSTAEDYEYLYEVTEPLVTSYACVNTWVPVSGVETTQMTENGVSTSLTIDYGDGNCDNLALVTENGKTYTVDFEELWNQYYDEGVSTGVAESVPGNGK